MLKNLIPFVMVLTGCSPAEKELFSPPIYDRTVSGESQYPVAVDVAKVGSYPGLVKSGAGYFYDDVLEYRVWVHPERGAEKKNDGDDYFAAFAQYERATEYSRKTAGAEEPLVLIRQLKHINEPSPGVFEIVEGERIAEWQVPWLVGTKRMEGSVERFLKEHTQRKIGETDGATNGNEPVGSGTNRTSSAAAPRR